MTHQHTIIACPTCWKNFRVKTESIKLGESRLHCNQCDSVFTIGTKHIRRKKLEYAYPSSPLANDLNKGKGCWLVSDDSGLPPLVFTDKWKALKMFESINLPINITESFTRESCTFTKDPILEDKLGVEDILAGVRL